MNRTIGIIGTGEIAESHALAFGALGIGVVAYSRSERGRAAFRRTHGVRTVKSVEALLAAVDIVDICTPTDTHAGLAVDAARAGRHVIGEQPLARTLDQANSMITACDKAGVWLLPAHVVRFFPAYAAAKEAVASGRLGTPSSLRLSRGVAFPEYATWFGVLRRSGGVVVDLSIHDLDVARWIAGEVEEVRAEVETGDGGAAPHRSIVWLSHTSGATSEVTAGWEVPGTELRSTFTVAGTDGVVEFDSAAEPSLSWTGVASPPITDLEQDPMVAQLEEFLEVVAGRRASRVNAADGFAALAIALAAEQSAATGQPVKL